MTTIESSGDDGLCTAATNHNTRHPLITAAAAVTLHRSPAEAPEPRPRGPESLSRRQGIDRKAAAPSARCGGRSRIRWRERVWPTIRNFCPSSRRPG
ncbi:hypothetical protein [Nocardia rhamnosiphila]